LLGGVLKVAVVGHSYLAVSQALYFESIGASVTLFAGETPLSREEKSCRLLPELVLDHSLDSLVTQEIAELLKLKTNSEKLTYASLLEELYSPIKKLAHERIRIRQVEVKRIHKRFLSLDEEVKGRSRLHDLFRVVFKLGHANHLKEQIESNPQVFESMSDEIINSLSEGSEGFEDFDIVIEAQSESLKMGPGGNAAINEELVESKGGGISYYLPEPGFEKDLSKIAVVGTGLESAQTILGLRDWLLSGANQLMIVTTEVRPFEKLREETEHTELVQKLFELFDKSEEQWKKQCDNYQQKLHQWRALDPIVQAKTEPPSAPELPVVMLNGRNITSVDRLVDREGLFITTESPDFRGEEESVKTLACDHIVVCTGNKFVSKSTGMRIKSNADCIHEYEPGIYFLRDMPEIVQIVEKVLSFFSRNDN
jgi:hypothetical protein